MKFELIFYLARETEESLEYVEDFLASMGQSLSSACVTQTPKDLAVILAEAVNRSEILLISGGLLRTDHYNIMQVLSQALEIPLTLKPGYDRPNLRNAVTLTGGVILPNAGDGLDGCALTSGMQTIFLLPDTPGALDRMIQDSVIPYLCDRYSLNPPARQTSPVADGSTPPHTGKAQNISAAPEIGAGPAQKVYDPAPYDQEDKQEDKPGHTESKSKSYSTLYRNDRDPYDNYKSGDNIPPVRAEQAKPSWFARLMSRPAFAALFSLCLLTLLVFGAYSGYNLLGQFRSAEQNRETYEKVRQLYGQTSDATLPAGTLEKFGKLYESNSDIRAWIHIPGTGVDFPVVQSAAPDDTYARHDFFRSASKYGTPYLDFNNNIYRDTGNLIIYGSNYHDDTMFSDLVNLTRPEYYIANNLVALDTLQQETTWQIFSVCLVDSAAQSSEFDYTKPQALDAYDFAKFIYQLRMRSYILSDVAVSTADRLLLLITDSDEFEGAKLLVAAVQYENIPTVINVDNTLSVKNPTPLMPQRWYDVNGGVPPELEEGDYQQLLAQAGTSLKPSASNPTSENSSSKGASSGNQSDEEGDGADGDKSSADSETLSVKFNGEVVTGPVLDIVSRIVEVEMGSSYSDEALKAQAVAAYTYILWESGRGVTPSVTLKKASSKVTAAVTAVLGKKMTLNGETPYTPYFLMSAGKTADNKTIWETSLPHLVPADSSWETSESGHTVSTTISASKVQSRMKTAFGISLSGNPESWLSVAAHDSAVDTSAGYVSFIKIGSESRSGYKFSSALGLRSAAFTIAYKSGSQNFIFTTYGEGHGVGLSQTGAEGLAKQGKTYQEILKHYYKGVTIE